MADQQTNREFFHILREDMAYAKKSVRYAIPRHGFMGTKKRLTTTLLIDQFHEMREEEGKPPMERGLATLLGSTVGLDVADFNHGLNSQDRVLMAVAKPDKVYSLEQITPETLILPWFLRTAVPVIAVDGGMGSGKTNGAIKIYEVMKDYDYTLVHNIPKLEGHCIEEIEKVEETLREIPGNKIFIYDEAGRGGGARRPGSHLNVTTNDIVTQARKSGAAIIYITQLVRQQDAVIRDLANVIISREDAKTVIIEELFDKYIRKRIVNWPEAEMYHDGWGMSNMLSSKSKKTK